MTDERPTAPGGADSSPASPHVPGAQPGELQETRESAPAARGRLSRRGFLGAAGAGAVLGAAGGTGVTAAVMRQQRTSTGPRAEEVIRHNYSPHGTHQAGIVTPTPAVTHLIALDLLPAARSVDALARLMRLWSGDVAALMAGRGVTGDVTPELAQQGVSLSITLGLGPTVFALPGLAAKKPAGLVEVPAMRHDKLDPRWGSADLLLIVAADDPTTVAYASRALLRDAETFARVRWVQEGAWRGTNAEGNAVTGRNLFGQLDGSANPKGAELDATVWPTDPPAWFAGGTTLVIRRIQMDLEEWDKLTRNEQEQALGRRFDGSPLTGGDEFATPDFAAKDANGRPVMPLDSHVRRTHPSQNSERRILRRGLNYTRNEWVDGKLEREAGLLFLSFQADVAKQFVPLQHSVDQLDSLNTWTTHVGSSVWAIPPGFSPDSWLCRDLLS